MVIWGKHDKMLQWEPMKNAVVADLNVKPENIHVIDSKHYIQEESTDEILQFITEFIE